MYIISKIETEPKETLVDGTTRPRLTRVTLQAPSDCTSDVATVIAGDYCWIHSLRHLNGGTQAFVRGDFDETEGYPLTEPAESTQNVDYVDDSLDASQQPDVHTVRADYIYDFIKNDKDWDYLYSKGVNNPLYSFLSGDTNQAKLKFFSKTASNEKIEIAIANVEDFKFENGENYAIAFSDTTLVSINNTMLTSLFYYYPRDNEIAIAIRAGGEIETFICSFDETALDGNNMSSYIENVINDNSKYVYVLDNRAVEDMPASYLVADRFGWATDSTGLIDVGVPNNNHYDITSINGDGTYITVVTDRKNYLVANKPITISDTTNYDGTYTIYDIVDETTFRIENVLNPGLENSGTAKPTDQVDTYGVHTNTLTVQGGRTPIISIGSLRNAYQSVADKEIYEIDVVIGNEYTDNDYDNQNPAIELAMKRKDCVAYIGALYEDTVGQTTADATQNVINYITETNPNYRRGSIQPTRTMFAAFFANYFRIYDNYNKKFRWINIAGDMAGIRCQVSTKKDPWWVSAGTSRGIITGIDKIAFMPNQDQRDNMYKNGINPIVNFPKEGTLVWGNKTLHPVASSFDRINVRMLFNTLERTAAKAARSQVFEFNDAYTRNTMLSLFNPYLAQVKAGRGITDYLVVCDESNNTIDVISRNEMRVDIYIKPNYAAEMILITFTNVGTRSFASVIGA